MTAQALGSTGSGSQPDFNGYSASWTSWNVKDKSGSKDDRMKISHIMGNPVFNLVDPPILIWADLMERKKIDPAPDCSADFRPSGAHGGHRDRGLNK